MRSVFSRARGNRGPVLSWRRGPSVREVQSDALPLYIHEKVNPSAFIEQLTRAETGAEQMDWFAEFNGLPTDAKYDWYKFKGTGPTGSSAATPLT